jgi:hypothetical protein
VSGGWAGLGGGGVELGGGHRLKVEPAALRRACRHEGGAVTTPRAARVLHRARIPRDDCIRCVREWQHRPRLAIAACALPHPLLARLGLRHLTVARRHPPPPHTHTLSPSRQSRANNAMDPPPRHTAGAVGPSRCACRRGRRCHSALPSAAVLRETRPGGMTAPPPGV